MKEKSVAKTKRLKIKENFLDIIHLIILKIYRIILTQGNHKIYSKDKKNISNLQSFTNLPFSTRTQEFCKISTSAEKN